MTMQDLQKQSLQPVANFEKMLSAGKALPGHILRSIMAHCAVACEVDFLSMVQRLLFML